MEPSNKSVANKTSTLDFMVCLHYPIPIPVKLGFNMILRRVHSGSRQIPMHVLHPTRKERSHVTNFSPSLLFGPLLFSIVLMVTG